MTVNALEFELLPVKEKTIVFKLNLAEAKAILLKIALRIIYQQCDLQGI